MKKVLSLALVFAVLFALCIGAVPASAEEASDSQTPLVSFYGHQRTVTADSGYGIRLIGFVKDLTPKAVGFDLAIIHEDGTVAYYSQEVDTVYSALHATVEGKDTTVTADALSQGVYGHLYTLQITDIPTDKGFIGFLCSAYYIMDDAAGTKVSCKTEKVIYKGSMHWTESYVAGDKISAEYLAFGDGKGGQETKYIYGPSGYQGKEDCIRMLWDGAVNGNSYINYYNWDNAGAWSSAELEKETVIGKITLTSYGHHYRNKGVAVQASVDGENWVTLYTVSDADAAFVAGSAADWSMRSLDIAVADTTAYKYVRVLDTTGNGYCLAEVEVYEKLILPPLEQVAASYIGFGDGKGGQETKYIYGPSDYKGKEDCIKLLWDGAVNGNSYINYYNWDNAGAWTSAALDGETVIQKITVTSYGYHFRNKGVAIQASVDGEDWVTLYTISESDTAFVAGTAADWSMRSLDIAVSDATAYKYVRVLDTTGNGYCLAEVAVYRSAEGYNQTFAVLLNTTLPKAE